jgi:hypothetical protein
MKPTIKLTRSQQRLADAKKSYERIKTKHDDAIRLLVRMYGQLRVAERDVARYTKAVRQERKGTKEAMAEAVSETREFFSDSIGI